MNEIKAVNTNPRTANYFGMMSTKEETAKKRFNLRRIDSLSRRKLVEGNLKKDTTNKVREKRYECPPEVKSATMTDKKVKR